MGRTYVHDCMQSPYRAWERCYGLTRIEIRFRLSRTEIPVRWHGPGLGRFVACRESSLECGRRSAGRVDLDSRLDWPGRRAQPDGELTAGHPRLLDRISAGNRPTPA